MGDKYEVAMAGAGDFEAQDTDEDALRLAVTASRRHRRDVVIYHGKHVAGVVLYFEDRCVYVDPRNNPGHMIVRRVAPRK